MTLKTGDDYGVQALDINQTVDALLGYSVRLNSGSGVSASVASGMTVDIGDGEVSFGGAIVNVLSQSVTLSTGGSDPRKDAIYIDSSGTANVAEGTPEPAVPSGETREDTYRPAIPDLKDTDGVVIAEVWVGPGVTSLTSADLRDRRIDINASNAPIRSGLAKRIVYSDNSRWVSMGQTSTKSFVRPGDALQHAADNSGRIYLRDNIPTNDPVERIVDLGTSDLIGAQNRRAEIYVNGEETNIGIRKTATGTIQDIGLNGTPDAASSTFTTVDLLWLDDMGRGSLIDNIDVFGTRGNGIVVAGCQQMTFRNVTVATCGNPSNDTWHIYLTNSSLNDVGTNSNLWLGLQSHGSAGVEGGLIAMRADQNTNDKYPRTQKFIGINVENGPTDTDTPLIEVETRGHLFTGGRINNIDDASEVFLAGTNSTRAINNIITNLTIFATDGDPTDVYSNGGNNGSGRVVPQIGNCVIRANGTGILLDSHNQSINGLNVQNTDFRDTPQIINVSASKDAGQPITLQGIGGTGDIRVQGAPLVISTVPEASWETGFVDEFGPSIYSDDGSFTPLYGQTDLTNNNGYAFIELRDTCQMPGGVHVETEVVADNLGNRPYIIESNGSDAGGDGRADRLEARVYNRDGTLVGQQDVELAFYGYPHR